MNQSHKHIHGKFNCTAATQSKFQLASPVPVRVRRLRLVVQYYVEWRPCISLAEELIDRDVSTAAVPSSTVGLASRRQPPSSKTARGTATSPHGLFCQTETTFNEDGQRN